jgi:osmoprotectant transport system permease protein
VELLQFMADRADDLAELTLASAGIIAAVVVISTILSVAVALAVYRRPRWSNVALSTFSVFLTIPSFALFGLMVPIVGLGATGPIIALVLYSLLPITRNTIVGLQGVDPAVIDAARGMGMSRNRVLLTIELPLAWPVIVTGIRVAAQIAVGISAIAAFVNGGGLGEYIFRGLRNFGSANDLSFALSGTILLVLLALLLDVLFQGIERITTPRGIRD